VTICDDIREIGVDLEHIEDCDEDYNSGTAFTEEILAEVTITMNALCEKYKA